MMVEERDTKSTSALRAAKETSAARPGNTVSAALPAVANATPTESGAHRVEREMQNEELRRSQQLLEESRDRYLGLYLFAPVGYLTLTDTGVIIDANIAAADFLGVERKKLLQRGFESFLNANDSDYWRREFLGRIQHESKIAVDLALQRDDGNVSYAHVVGWHLAPEGKAAVIRITLVDITERKRVEESLHESEEHYRALFHGAMEGIMLVDGEGNIVSVNEAFARMHGYDLDEFLAMNLRDLDAPETSAQASARLARILSGESIRFEVEHFHKDGSRVTLDVSACPIDINGKRLALAFHRDVTERKQIGQALAQEKARLSAILNSAMEAIVTVDASHRIVLFNPAAEAVFGYSATEVIGTPLERLVPERFRATHAEQLRRFGASGGKPLQVDSRQRDLMGLRRNGEEFPFEASISQISEGGQKLYTMLLRDITRQIENETEMRQMQEELHEISVTAQSLRERERSRIARELHDELGQALTALKMDVRWIMERLPAEQAAAAEKLEKMLTILDGTTSATRRIASNLRPLILDDLGLLPAAEWLVENFREHSGLHCRLAIDDPCLELIEPYATAIFRTLQEALTNIAKHANASLVEVAIGVVDGEAILTVRDNGRGFEVSNPRKPESFGLMGLRERAHLAGGNLNIDSGLGRGTTVEVRIPIARPDRGDGDFSI